MLGEQIDLEVQMISLIWLLLFWLMMMNNERKIDSRETTMVKKENGNGSKALPRVFRKIHTVNHTA